MFLNYPFFLRRKTGHDTPVVFWTKTGISVSILLCGSKSPRRHGFTRNNNVHRSRLPRCTNLLSFEALPGKIRLRPQGACDRRYFFPLRYRVGDMFYRPMPPLLECWHRQNNRGMPGPGFVSSPSSPGSSNDSVLNPSEKDKSRTIWMEPSSIDELKTQHAMTLG